MYQINDIVQSIRSKIKYKVLGLPRTGDPQYKLEALETSPDFNRWIIYKGDKIYLAENEIKLVQAPPNQPIVAMTQQAYQPKIGDKVYLVGPEIPNGGYGFNNTMRAMLDDGIEYEIRMVDQDSVYLVGCMYTWLFAYLRLSSSSLGSVILGPNAPTPKQEQLSEEEEEDPFGLIAQRKALRDLIGF